MLGEGFSRSRSGGATQLYTLTLTVLYHSHYLQQSDHTSQRAEEKHHKPVFEALKYFPFVN